MELDWMKIGRAGLLIMFLIILWPATRWWSKNSPKAGEGDWSATLFAIGGVVLFVLLLVMMVRG